MSLASIYSARGKHDLAEPLLQQVLEWRESWVKFSMGLGPEYYPSKVFLKAGGVYVLLYIYFYFFFFKNSPLTCGEYKSKS